MHYYFFKKSPQKHQRNTTQKRKHGAQLQNDSVVLNEKFEKINTFFFSIFFGNFFWLSFFPHNPKSENLHFLSPVAFAYISLNNYCEYDICSKMQIPIVCWLNTLPEQLNPKIRKGMRTRGYLGPPFLKKSKKISLPHFVFEKLFIKIWGKSGKT